MNELTDTRHQSYVEYQMSVITITRSVGLLCGIKSMRETTEKLDTEETIKNIGNILGIELEEIPHYDPLLMLKCLAVSKYPWCSFIQYSTTLSLNSCEYLLRTNVNFVHTGTN